MRTVSAHFACLRYSATAVRECCLARVAKSGAAVGPTAVTGCDLAVFTRAWSPYALSMGDQREGGCSCGALRYRLASAPLFVHCCHCRNCQRQTGSAFVVNLLIETNRLEVTQGAAQPVDVPRDDGSMQRIFRCRQCQVAVFSEYGRPEVRFVRAGTLDDSTDVTPDVHIFTRSKASWVALPESTPADRKSVV
jgi:hypothetical protein